MKRLLLTLAFVCFVMPVLLSADTPESPLTPRPALAIRPESVTVDRNGEIHLFAINTRLPFGHMFYEAPRKTEPPKAAAAPAPVTLESLKARRAQMQELMRQYGEAAKQYAADVAELKRQAKELNIELDIKPVDFGIGKQGPRGYSAYEVAKQNGFKGTQAEWLASLKGPKGDKGEKGEKGDPGGGPVPPPVVDSFTKAVQDAWADPGTNKTYLESLISVWKTLGEYAATDATTGALYARYDAGFKAAELGGKMPAVMDIINKPLLDLMGGTSKPFTDDLRGKVKTQISKTLDVLGTLKR